MPASPVLQNSHKKARCSGLGMESLPMVGSKGEASVLSGNCWRESSLTDDFPVSKDNVGTTPVVDLWPLDAYTHTYIHRYIDDIDIIF